MPTTEFLSPGVYPIETTPKRSLEGLSAATAAFVGWTEKGPTNRPIRVRSVEEFTSIFGNINTRGQVAIGMRPYFNTGGQFAWIVRVVPTNATTADVDIDSPAKWTFTALGAGSWGNSVTIRIRGNRNFLDRTVSPPAWTKFDVLILVPASFDSSFLIADETYEAVQFTDATASDYILAAITDPRDPSLLVSLTVGTGGTPAGLIGSDETDENIGTGNGVLTQFTGTLTTPPVLSETLRIVTGGAQVNDEAQTVAPVPNGTAVDFTGTLPSAPILDASLRLFYGQATPITNFVLPVVGLINGVNTSYTVASAALSAVHRETAIFRIKYAATAGASPQLLHTVGGVDATYNLAGTPLTNTPVHPGTVSIAVTDASSAAQTITDNGAGILTGTGGVLPGGGTINYDTGAMTGTTALLDALSTVTATYRMSNVITKAATADNLNTAVALAGSLGVGANTIALVNSTTTPTGSGPISFVTAVAPLSGTSIYVDYIRLRIVNSTLAGVLTGDVGAGPNTINFETGAFAFEGAVAPRTGLTVDADYQTGLEVLDDGLGNLIGDVNPLGANTINYETGAYDVTFVSAPLNGAAVLANYSSLPNVVDYDLSGGADGTAVARANISAPALEATQQGIYALDQVEDTLNVALPDFDGSLLVQQDLIDFCEARNSRFAVLGFAPGTTAPAAVQYVLTTAAFDTRCAAIYWPNVYFLNDQTNRPELVSVTPFVCGVYAKTAQRRTVGKAPAGIDDGLLNGEGTVGPEFDRQVNDINIRNDLFQSRINPLYNSIATGFVVWGALTLSRERRWQNVNTRLLNDFLMESLRRNLQWVVFETNGPQLWLKVETTLKGYMSSLWSQGYFGGARESQAYFVKCGPGNNTQATLDAGKVIVDVGFTAGEPALFVPIQLSQPASTTTV